MPLQTWASSGGHRSGNSSNQHPAFLFISILFIFLTQNYKILMEKENINTRNHPSNNQTTHNSLIINTNFWVF